MLLIGYTTLDKQKERERFCSEDVFDSAFIIITGGDGWWIVLLGIYQMRLHSVSFFILCHEQYHSI